MNIISSDRIPMNNGKLVFKRKIRQPEGFFCLLFRMNCICHVFTEKPYLGNSVLFTEKLSENIPFVRADVCSVNGNIYFGEMTYEN